MPDRDHFLDLFERLKKTCPRLERLLFELEGDVGLDPETEVSIMLCDISELPETDKPCEARDHDKRSEVSDNDSENDKSDYGSDVCYHGASENPHNVVDRARPAPGEPDRQGLKSDYAVDQCAVEYLSIILYELSDDGSEGGSEW
ncbi:hypothetical protein QFC24_005476 [Naganishia onofrii]|uniref:Uncharacterized protein n=1 Tax=Naganishia onofrii TaxID=1851511 RepID=A0ACC2X7J6_9TREE|nr:hypothetical protein QFC24_005476 [Naganishia onofrii]